MEYRTVPGTGEAGYLQLYRRLRGQITDGSYPYGAKLPSKRLLAEEAGVSVITAEHAYALLLEEGYAEARTRSGYYVIYRDADFLNIPKEACKNTAEAVLKERVGSGAAKEVPPAGETAGGTAPTGRTAPAGKSVSGRISYALFARTARKVLLDAGERLLVKSPNNGLPELRVALVGYLARTQGVHVTPEQIVIGSGAEYLYTLVTQLFPGQVFGIEDPCYEKIRQVYRASGIDTDPLRLASDGIAGEELARTGATVLHVTPFHSYPSGVTASASKRAEYLHFARIRNGYLIEDNYDAELTVSVKNESTLFSQSEDGRVIYLNTFSHTVAPSVRVGYMVLPAGLLSRFARRLGFYSCTVPVFEQYLLAELIGSGDFERHINRVRREKRRRG